ncbi:MAG: group 1 truncated hemoglobin [Rhodoferax sp.]|uniref:group I truncated hemoglobin n=1 Tax=Rhodoferax sp. TaxID=50421 RepID=UPI002ACEA45D|nr:group 1 truncated hemoglobin [Rhodoferax sp.]MDZ7891573.1 group 1 truncated hemoglobin [Rhodoferax sp.]
MKTLAIAALVALSSLATFNTYAQTAAPAAVAKNDALYQALGGKPGLQALMDVFVAGLKADKRIGEQFKDTKSSFLASQLVDQVCMVTGGPCKYDGADMKTAHADMGITRANFHALVEVLQVSMDARNIPFSTQNQLLALLAPMHRDIVTAK